MKFTVLVYSRPDYSRCRPLAYVSSMNTAGAAGNSHFFIMHTCTVQRPLIFTRPVN